MNAQAGCLRPKKIIDQPAFKASCPKYPITSLDRTASLELARQARQMATAISTYKTVQTGPKIQLGGFHDGLCSSGYQVRTFANVAREPMAPAVKLAAIKPTSLNPDRDALTLLMKIAGG